MNSARFALPLTLCLLTVACGGGGSSTAPPRANAVPTAEAGATQTVSAGAVVELDGSASSDSDGSLVSFAWAQSDGPDVALDGADGRIASFTAPAVNAETGLVFTLTVTDDDGATASDSVTIAVSAPEPVEEVSVSGRVLPAASQDLDGDTNDPFNPPRDNDTPGTAQRIGNPTTLGGYVNEPGAGAEGPSQLDGDREDFFVVDLLAGQTLNLLVAEFQDADADLYLYSLSGELLDFSIETGQRETIVVEDSGTYLVNVSIFAGATNYTLTIGSSLTPVARHHHIVEDQAIVNFRASDENPDVREALGRRLRFRELGGGPRRSRLLRFERVDGDQRALRERLGAQRHRRSQFARAADARRWHTLIGIKELARRPEVASAEPNYRLLPQASVNDEAYAFQWHYPLINLPGAWNTSTGSPGVIVAVIDTGVLGGHPDLAGQLVAGFDFIRDPLEAADGDGIDADPEESIGGADPAAINFHGSHVTGTVAARGNNGLGVAGVAFGARVMPLRAITASGGTLYDVNQAIRFAAGLANDSGSVPPRRADIINLSLAGGGFSPSTQRLFDAVRDLGIIVVAAAGNEGSSLPAYPASYDGVISVSAVDTQQNVTGYSNTGGRIDVAAPGGDGSVDRNGDGYPDGVLSTGGSDGGFAYTFLSGTSMASPHVAGVFALMKSVNPDLTASDVERLLVAGALTDDLGIPGRDDRFGHGLINARKAIDAALIEAGNSIDVPPRLSASTLGLNFGNAATRLDVILRNGGGGELGGIGLTTSTPWISVEPVDVDASGAGQYAVRVDRSALAPGVYEGALRADSQRNALDIRVLVAVTDATESELGQIYLLLYDPVTDEVAAQTLAQRDGEAYRYELPAVPAGRYQIFAGTDIDNDLLICDAGEACGAYLTIDQPLTLDIEADRDNLDFAVEYLIALPGAANSDVDGRIKNLPTLERSRSNP